MGPAFAHADVQSGRVAFEVQLGAILVSLDAGNVASQFRRY